MGLKKVDAERVAKSVNEFLQGSKAPALKLVKKTLDNVKKQSGDYVMTPSGVYMPVKKYTPTASDVHINFALTNISVAYLQSATDFIGRQVFPEVRVQHQSNAYYIIDRGDFNRLAMKKRAPGTESAGTGWRLSDEKYFCENWAVHQDIPDEVGNNADPAADPYSIASQFLTQQVLLQTEVEWNDNFFVQGAWGNESQGVAATPTYPSFLQWNDAASDPIVDVRRRKTDVKRLTGFEPNTLVMGREVWDACADNPAVIDRIKYSGGVSPSNPAIVSREALAQLFEVERILIMNAVQNTGKEGAAEVSNFIGGKNVLIAYVAPTPSLMTPSAGYTFLWNGQLGAEAAGQRILRFRLTKEHSDRMEIHVSQDQKKVSDELGHFMYDVVA